MNQLLSVSVAVVLGIGSHLSPTTQRATRNTLPYTLHDFGTNSLSNVLMANRSVMPAM